MLSSLITSQRLDLIQPIILRILMTNKDCAQITSYTYYIALASIVNIYPSSLVYYNHLVNIYEVAWYNSFFLYKKSSINSYTTVINNATNYFNIHFIRLQKHYNKRRYLRVRVISRPSFWSGMLLSTISLGMFWSSSCEFIDWFTTQLLLINMEYILLLIYLLIIFRAYNTYNEIYFKDLRAYVKLMRSKLSWVYQYTLIVFKWFN